MKHLRSSRLYTQLLEQMNNISKYAIDEMFIENSGVKVSSVAPSHLLIDYSFKQNGKPCRNENIARITALLLAQDFQLLQDSSIYQFKRYRIYRLNGKKEYGYRYTMHRYCKDQIFSFQSRMQKNASLFIR
ncbi:MAG: hypothetical protein Q4E07_00380 [Eubacteriales bacterium]|nr:hypothetical protein [Eubacteriales bacterium]